MQQRLAECRGDLGIGGGVWDGGLASSLQLLLLLGFGVWSRCSCFCFGSKRQISGVWGLRQWKGRRRRWPEAWAGSGVSNGLGFRVNSILSSASRGRENS